MSFIKFQVLMATITTAPVRQRTAFWFRLLIERQPFYTARNNPRLPIVHGLFLMIRELLNVAAIGLHQIVYTLYITSQLAVSSDIRM